MRSLIPFSSSSLTNTIDKLFIDEGFELQGDYLCRKTTDELFFDSNFSYAKYTTINFIFEQAGFVELSTTCSFNVDYLFMEDNIKYVPI